ncbi:NRDE-2, necessary for RNA interference-domain-containing protein [Xylogone sp. PMI_703]|nr:NRDE-2, necessary for RNA interference-domain-containing protein [Xylogone sp. PMI_703]
MPESGQGVVPKFASFKPKSLSSVDAKEENHGDLKRKDAKRHKHRHRDDYQISSSRRKERLENDGPPNSLVKREHYSQGEPNELYIIDRQGDVKNLVYGSVHRYDVPSFHRIGSGCILGLPIDWKIDRDHGDAKDIVVINLNSTKSYSREKHIFSQVEKEKPKILRLRRELLSKENINPAADFVPLEEPRGNKRKRSGEGDRMEGHSESEDEKTHYRSILGKAKPEPRPLDDIFEYVTESDISDVEAANLLSLDNSLQQRSIQLSRNVEAHPDDVNAWQALIDHQDTIVSGGRENYRLTSAELTSTVDIKIHLYEKALANIKLPGDRDALLLGLMNQGSKVWDTTEQGNRWEKIAQDNMNSLLLWKSYLDFKMSNFSKFQFEDIRDIFVNRITQLLKYIQAAGPDVDDSLWQQLVYILLRFTLFLSESGFSELAIATWQGLLEMNYFAPSQTLSLSEKAIRFQEFWESEVPRVGEDGALGWQHFVATNDTSTVPDPEEDPTDCSIHDHQIFGSWVEAERRRSKASRRPARTLDEVTEDDPFRVILYSDIEMFTIHVPPKETLQKLLLDAFLVFCHLPPTPRNSRQTPQNILIHSLLIEELLKSNANWIKTQYCQAVDMGEGTAIDISSILTSPSANFSISPSTMFSNRWFRCFQSWSDVYSDDNAAVTYSLAQNTLAQLINAVFIEDLAEYYLAFTLRNEPKSVKKVSKRLLKKHPTSLRLYNAYAMIEWSQGNKDVAINTFVSILNLSKTLPEGNQKDSIYLWTNWVWGCVEDGDHKTGLRHLLSIPDGIPNDKMNFGPATLLRSKQHLTMNRDHLLSAEDLQHAILYVECLALLEYLSAASSREPQSMDQGDIASAMQIYNSFSDVLIARKQGHTTAHELLLQSATRLLYHHAHRGPFRPALLRHHLANFLALFPSNTIFLSLYAHNEARLRIDNRVRTLLITSTLTPENDTPSSRLFAIRYEMASPTSTIHSVRAAFEHAVASPVCRALPGIWRLYIFWCSWSGMDWGRIKEVWFRAVRQCPWAKELYLLGFEMLSGKVSDGELREVYKVMVEKGLRVHIDLQEKIEEFGL